MQLPPTLAWLVDAAAAIPSADQILAGLGARLVQDGVPLAGGALTLAVPHPLIARRTWLWRSETGEVIEALGFAGGGPAADASPDGGLGDAARSWLGRLGAGPVLEDTAGPGADAPALGWMGARPFDESEAGRLRDAARFAAAPLAALTARATLNAVLDAYLGRRSAARVLSAPLRRDIGEAIQAALLYADLRDFTALSEITPPPEVILALDAWFDRIAGPVHAFGGEVLKFIGDGMLAIFPVVDRPPRHACDAALRAVSAARAGMAHLNAERRHRGSRPLAFGAALHLGEMLWGNIGAANRLDFTAIGPAVNLVSRLEGLCRPLNRDILVSGAFAAQTATALVPLDAHELRGIASPCEVFAVP